ncbi:glycosyltransferase [Flavobacterium gelidilacus]|uniref:glycosyltransferase family 2 protein n=1 Tax=Flavobacterium gelidilacus TaxID=206041 RepID=UPI0004264BFF|nr:glycosyltransferase [Flavobacterium gelidilacus]
MINPKVSVIIPVYNAEKFIEKCCRSLFGQTLEDLEFIFINDCTPDNSIFIIKNVLKEFPNRILHVHFLNHTENKGVAISRQDGNDFAKGEYLIHCDSDDWVDLEAYETMYNEAKAKNADVVCCNYIVEYKDSTRISSFDYLEENKDNLILGIEPLYGALWNKLVKKEIIKKFSLKFFEDINMSEDLGLITRVRFYSKKTIVVPKPFYHYNQLNLDSIVTNFNNSKSDEIIKCVQNLEHFFIEHNAQDILFLQIQYLKFQAKQLLLINPKIRNFDYWYSIFPETHKNIWNFKQTPFNIKLIAWLVSNRMKNLATFLLFLKDNK